MSEKPVQVAPTRPDLTKSVTRLPSTAPRAHRLAHALAQRGWRGARFYWALADRFHRSSGMRNVEVARTAPIEVDLDDDAESTMFRGTYEHGESSLPAHFVRSGGCCIDAGANIGLYTVLLAGLAGRDGAVLAFEPSRSIRERLVRHVAELPQVTVFPYALGAAPGTATLYHWRGNAPIARLKRDLRLGQPIDEEIVEVRRLDDIPETGLSREIDFLKVDVTESEGELIAGAAAMFQQRRVRAAAVGEIAPVARAGSWVEPLGDAGYDVFRLELRPTRARLRRELRLVTPGKRVEWKILLVREDLTHLVAHLT